MTFYIGLVDGSPKHWGIWFPDLPGCTAMGHTMDQIFANAIAAIRDWIEVSGEPFPAPRLMSELMEDAEVTQIAKADKATFIQVPLLIDKGRSVKANISLDAGLLDLIDAAAERANVTRSSFLASAAREKMAKGM